MFILVARVPCVFDSHSPSRGPAISEGQMWAQWPQVASGYCGFEHLCVSIPPHSLGPHLGPGENCHLSPCVHLRRHKRSVSTHPTHLLLGLKALSSFNQCCVGRHILALHSSSRALSVSSPLAIGFIGAHRFFSFFYLVSNYTHMLSFHGEDATAINLASGKAFSFSSSSPEGVGGDRLA